MACRCNPLPCTDCTSRTAVHLVMRRRASLPLFSTLHTALVRPDQGSTRVAFSSRQQSCALLGHLTCTCAPEGPRDRWHQCLIRTTSMLASFHRCCLAHASALHSFARNQTVAWHCSTSNSGPHQFCSIDIAKGLQSPEGKQAS